MISDNVFVQQSLINNLFYLRTLKEYALNIELSFFGNNQELIDTARDFRNNYEKLLERAINLAENVIDPVLLDYQIFVTNYTLDTEELTEKLFGVDINTSLTEKQLAQKSNGNKNVNQETIDSVMQLNKDAFTITENFLDFIKYNLEQIERQELFSYSYPTFYRYMITETALFISELARLISKSGVEPTYITGFKISELQSMKRQAQFIKGLADPEQVGVINQANQFVNDFNDLIENFQNVKLSPEVQKVLNEQSLEIVERFRAFVSTIIERVLASELYFIVEPIFFDNLLTDINYFIYLLKGSELGIVEKKE